MPGFSPFPGIRFDTERYGTDLSAVGAPPYDVIDEDHRVALESRSAHNTVRLILPQDERQEGDRYEVARRRFFDWISAGDLVGDTEPGFYTYRMEFTGPHGEPRHTLGVLGAITLPAADAPDATAILPHERTMAKAKSDRLALLNAMRANLDPIWGLSLTPGLTALLQPSEPLATMVDDEGVRHSLGVIRDRSRLAAIEAAVAGSPLVLADGHHRYETAGNFLHERRGSGVATDDDGAIMGFVVELTDEEVCIQAIHRLLHGPSLGSLRSQLASTFRILDAGPNTPDGVAALEALMDEHGGIGLVDGHGLAVAVADPEGAETALLAEPAAVRDLDSALVETMIVPLLPDTEWQYRHSASECAALVDKGSAAAALILRAPTVVQTRRVAEALERMPQKTTFFYPKPRTGMVFRSLDS